MGKHESEGRMALIGKGWPLGGWMWPQRNRLKLLGKFVVVNRSLFCLLCFSRIVACSGLCRQRLGWGWEQADCSTLSSTQG